MCIAEGMKEKKNNVFADFICAAQYLVESGYTQPQRLAINGASNGGLLVGTELFSAVHGATAHLVILNWRHGFGGIQ